MTAIARERRTPQTSRNLWARPRPIEKPQLHPILLHQVRPGILSRRDRLKCIALTTSRDRPRAVRTVATVCAKGFRLPERRSPSPLSTGLRMSPVVAGIVNTGFSTIAIWPMGYARVQCSTSDRKTQPILPPVSSGFTLLPIFDQYLACDRIHTPPRAVHHPGALFGDQPATLQDPEATISRRDVNAPRLSRLTICEKVAGQVPRDQSIQPRPLIGMQSPPLPHHQSPDLDPGHTTGLQFAEHPCQPTSLPSMAARRSASGCQPTSSPIS